MKVIFEYTPSGQYAAQGGSPSGQEGYDVWLETGDWLGWFPKDELDEWVYFYSAQGEDVYLRRAKNE